MGVWQKAMSWVENIYAASSDFPKSEQFGMTSQLRRASVSVPANIAEGAERPGTKEFRQFIGIALGSLAEAETLVLLSSRLGYLKHDHEVELLEQGAEIGRMLHGLNRSLAGKL